MNPPNSKLARMVSSFNKDLNTKPGYTFRAIGNADLSNIEASEQTAIKRLARGFVGPFGAGGGPIGGSIGRMGNSVAIQNGTNLLALPRTVSGNIFEIGGTHFFGPGKVWSPFGGGTSVGNIYNSVHEQMAEGHSPKQIFRSFRESKGHRLLSNKWGTAFVPAVFGEHTTDISNMDLGNADVTTHLRRINDLYLNVSSPKSVSPEEYSAGVETARSQHRLFLGAVQRAGFNPLGVKAQLIREAGIVSNLTFQQLGFGLGYEEGAKGFHKRQNVLMVSKRIAEKNKFVTPVIGGSMMSHEMDRANEIAAIFGFKDEGITRFGTRNFLAFGQVGANNEILPLSMLGDSSAMGSGGMFEMFKDPAMRGHKLSKFHINMEDLKTGHINTKLRNSVLRAMHGNGAIYNAETNSYMFEKALRIKGNSSQFFEKTLGIPGLANALGGKGTILGFNQLGPKATMDDALRSVVASQDESLTVRGFRLLNGKLTLLANNPGMLHGDRNMAPVMLSGKAMNAELFKDALFNITDSSGQSLGSADIIARAEDVGLKIKNGQFVASEGFLSQHYIPKLAAASQRSGKLGQFASKLGFSLNAASKFSGEYISENDLIVGRSEALTKQLLGLSDNELADIGLNRADLGGFTLKNGVIGVGKESLRYAKVNGQTLIGFDSYSSTAARTQQVGLYSQGGGALKIRMMDYTPILRQKQSMSGNAKIGGAYGNVAAFIEGMMLQGPQNYNKPGLGAVSSEVASIAHMVGDFGKGGLYKNTKLNPVIGLAEFLKNYKPIAPTLRAAKDMLRRGAVSTETLAGTLHATGSGRVGGFILDLPHFIEIPGMKRDSGVRRISQLAVPSDVLLGSEAVNSSVFFGRNAGFHGKGLGRHKALTLAALHEEASAHLARGGNLNEFKASDRLGAMMSTLAHGLDFALEGKGGILDSTLRFSPKSGMNLITVNRGDIGFGQAALNPHDARRYFKGAGYGGRRLRALMSGREANIGLLDRQPAHGPNAISTARIIIDPTLKRGHIGLRGEALRAKSGDFDYDIVRLWTDKRIEGSLGTIHQRESNLYGSIFELDRRYQRSQIGRLMGNIEGGNGVMSVAEDKFLKLVGGSHSEAAIEAALAREGGAGGGALLTRYSDLFAKNLTRMGHLISDFGDAEKASTISQMLSGLGDDALAADLRQVANSSTIGQLGILRDAFVNATLNKSSAGSIMGFGDTPLNVALSEYAKDRSAGSLDKLSQVIAGSLWDSAPEYINPSGKGNLQVLELMSQAGVAPGDTTDIIRGKIEAYAGQHAKGIGDIYTLFTRIHETSPEHAISAFYSNDPSIGKQLNSREARSHFFGTSQASLHEAETDAASEAKGTIAGIQSRINKIKKETADKMPNVLERVGAMFDNINWGSKTKWAVGGVAAIAGISALSDAFEDNDPTPPVYMPSYNSSPLPPPVAIEQPDSGMQYPSRFRFPSQARIERPYATRPVYNIMANGDESADFGNLIATSPGRTVMPARNSYLKDTRSERELPYQIRERLKGSF